MFSIVLELLEFIIENISIKDLKFWILMFLIDSF